MPYLLIFFLSLWPSFALADIFQAQTLKIPMVESGTQGLETLLVLPKLSGKYPLVMMSHGSSVNPANRAEMTTNSLLPMATEFVRRGWAVAIVIRRGFGRTGGPWAETYGSCKNPNYIKAGLEAAKDLQAALQYLKTLPQIDSQNILAVGVSAGGFASLALAAQKPAGLQAVISFAGGRGSIRDNEVCGEQAEIEAFVYFGKTVQIPTLWIYAQNDHYFNPTLSQKFYQAFTQAGGRADLVRMPAFEEEGHFLFSVDGIPLWIPKVTQFLDQAHLSPPGPIIDLPPPILLPMPKTLSTKGKQAFTHYLRSPLHKAFALSQEGDYGYSTGRYTAAEAEDKALEFCEAESRDCELYARDNALI